MSVIKRFAVLLAAVILPMILLSACSREETAAAPIDPNIVVITIGIVMVVGIIACATFWIVLFARASTRRLPAPPQCESSHIDITRPLVKKTDSDDVANHDSDGWDSDGGGD